MKIYDILVANHGKIVVNTKFYKHQIVYDVYFINIIFSQHDYVYG